MFQNKGVLVSVFVLLVTMLGFSAVRATYAAHGSASDTGMSMYAELSDDPSSGAGAKEIEQSLMFRNGAALQSQSLDYALDPIYGERTLEAGFLPDPSQVTLISGGSIAVSALDLEDECTGYATAAPSFRLHWDGDSDLLRILFVVDEGDTTLIVNDPGGRWFCNDDTNGLDPELQFRDPVTGQYDIWVGSYRRGQSPAGRLSFTEFATLNPSQDPQVDARLIRGALAVVVSNGSGLREEPDLQSRRVGWVRQNATLELLEGPVYADGAAWWRVYTRESGREAWISEGSVNDHALEPVPAYSVCGGNDSSRMSTGNTVYVLSTETVPNRIRRQASIDSRIVGHLFPRQMAQVVGGPRCADGYVWWHIERNGVRGWTAEGNVSRYFLGPVNVQ